MNTYAESTATKTLAQIKMTINEQPIIIELFDNPASKQLLSQLPLKLELTDFANTEKIAYLSQKLTTQATPTADKIQSDFTYYAPWGNIALFYKDYGQQSVYALGVIKTGKEQLTKLKHNVSITLKPMD